MTFLELRTLTPAHRLLFSAERRARTVARSIRRYKRDYEWRAAQVNDKIILADKFRAPLPRKALILMATRGTRAPSERNQTRL